MANVNIDWEGLLDEIEEGEGVFDNDLLPPGTYPVRVIKAEKGLSKNGNEKIEMTFEVTEDPGKGKWIWDRVNFAVNSKKSMAITINQLGTLGVSRNWLAANSPSVEQIAAKLVGREISVKIGHRTYEGETYYDVKGYEVAKSTSPF